jgi:hypothetical protein
LAEPLCKTLGESAIISPAHGGKVEEGMCILYYCYGLNIESVPVSEADKRAAEICELSKGEAGKDGRHMRYVCMVPKADLLNAINSAVAKGL